MKKILLLSIAAFTLCVISLFPSCKKTQHNPTDDKYTFTYDGNGRVSEIVFATNSPGAPIVAENMYFTYAGDSIYKTIYETRTNKVLERDTFIINTSNQVISAYNPGSIFNYTYFGNLLAKETNIYRDSGTSITYRKTYTSDNADLLNRYFDGTLTANFSDTGYKSTAVVVDTDFSRPFSATWVEGTNVLIAPSLTITHTGISSFQDVITGYNMGGPILLTATDSHGVSLRGRTAIVVPGDLWAQESFFVWPDLANRTGDYLQLASYTTYGIDIYANAHLVKFITNPGNNTYITYDIDGNSKITQTTAIIRDSLTHNATTVVYRVQYATF
jgi:hypothetical protein